MSKLNNQQLSVVNCDADKILVLAGAGTGKTTTMLARISHLVDTGVSPSSILVLTFTNAAAFEMKDRYQRSHKDRRSIPEFRTFHSFCYYVLSTNPAIRKSLGYSSTPEIADDNARKRILREAGSITNIKSSLESLSKKKKRTVKEQYEYETLQKTVSKLLKKENSITFDELCTKICKLFNDDSDLVCRYKAQYKYIFVDEFQDTDPTQYKFVKSFLDSKLMVVGDALQSLYAFRGADSSIIKSLAVDPSWHTIRLSTNYRSTRSICQFANDFSTYADDSFRVVMNPGRDVDGEAVYRNIIDEKIFKDLYHDCTKTCANDLTNHPGSTAILVRTNKEVRALQDYFDSHGLQYRVQKKDQDIRNIVSAITSNEFLMDWIVSYLNAEKYAQYIRLSALSSDTRIYSIQDFVTDFVDTYAVKERVNLIKVLRKICKEENRSVMDRCQDILEILGCSYLQLDETICLTMRDALDHIVEKYTSSEEAPGVDVYIGTVHSVKGLEFDNVYVLGVNGPTFKLNGEENNNVYYVAMTRAKNYLRVFVKEFKDAKF